MTKSSPFAPLALLAAVLVVGCGPGKPDSPNSPPPADTSQTQPGSSSSPTNAGAPSGIKPVMMKIGGPQGLVSRIGNELNAAPPPWDDLQTQSKDLTAQAAALGGQTPAKGTKESWDKHVKDFSDLAAALDAAVQAKDQGKAKDAQAGLGKSCGACHQDHRGRPGPGAAASAG